MDIWQYYRAITRRLLIWSILSVMSGVVLLFIDPFWRGIGVEAIAWGLIDAAIALVGGWLTRRRRTRQCDPVDPQTLSREARNLRRVLWINTGLDVVYVSGGIALALTSSAGNPFWRGNGWGIVIQGGFLFFFDLLHALGVPKNA